MTHYDQRGIKPEDLRQRYDVECFLEDEWHKSSDVMTKHLVSDVILNEGMSSRDIVLNVGSGVHSFDVGSSEQVHMDIFSSPIMGKSLAVCGNAQQMPFRDSSFAATICVGEVLAYCDPVRLIGEMSRVTRKNGVAILDFGSSDSIRHAFRKMRGSYADIVSVPYAGRQERTWVYSINYIRGILHSFSFTISSEFGWHSWSSLLQRIGAPTSLALSIQRKVKYTKNPLCIADLITVVARKI